MEENNNPIQENGTQANQNNGVKKQNPMGIVSLVFSLVGLIIAAIPAGLVALITGIIGVTKFDSATQKGKGLAIAGIVIGVIDIISGIVLTIIRTATVLM